MLERCIDSTLRGLTSIIPSSIYASIVSRDVLGIFYHAVSDEPLHHVRYLYPIVPVRVFKDALEYLRDRYNFIRYSDLHEHKLKGNDLPPRALHLSFDDGYQECYSVVRPILLELDIPCTFFITTDFVDDCKLFYRNIVSLCIECFMRRSTQDKNRVLFDLNQVYDIELLDAKSFMGWMRNLRSVHGDILENICRILDFDLQLPQKNTKIYLSTEQIRQLCADGFTLGAHTKTHRKLGILPEVEIQNEIVDSCQFIQDITDQEIVPFSFPHSSWGVDRKLLAELRDRNPFIGLLFDTKGLRQDVDFIVNRVWAERIISLDSGMSSIHQTIRAAYQEQSIDVVMDWGRRLKRRVSFR